MSSKTFPTSELERTLFSSGVRYLISIDEVGRGALAGPVAVGAVLIDSSINLDGFPKTLQDSKLMTEPQREAIFDELRECVTASSVGEASAVEIDRIGIVAALSLAANRAIELLLAQVAELNIDKTSTRIILDGTHDWLSQSSGFGVVVRAKADRDCVSVAAASVIAKVHRDRIMVGLHEDYPEYGFAGHKGYGAASHIEAIRAHGPRSVHRSTWLGKILGDGMLPELENF